MVSQKHRVLYTYPTDMSGMKLLRNIAEIEVIREKYSEKIPEEELREKVRDADAIINVRGVNISRRVIEIANKLKIVARHGMGYNEIDVKAATEKGIIVTIAHEEGPHVVAEHIIGLAIALSRNFLTATLSVKRGEWKVEKFIGYELRGKTMGIIGLGRIGSEVAKRAKTFKIKLLVYDPYIKKMKAKKYGALLVDSLNDLLGSSDYVVITAPLTEETNGMIDEKELEVMKDGSFLINCARGVIVNEKALYKALKNGKLLGAGIDVFSEEPPPKNNPLFELKNVILTPHIAGVTKESLKRLSISTAKSVFNVLSGKLPDIENIVNPKVLDKLNLKD